jgi:hypothetical protein
MMQIQAFRCEKIPEEEFDRDKKWALEPGWRETFRKDGMVYIVYDPEKTAVGRDDGLDRHFTVFSGT